jgi:hypothetical protein
MPFRRIASPARATTLKKCLPAFDSRKIPDYRFIVQWKYFFKSISLAVLSRVLIENRVERLKHRFPVASACATATLNDARRPSPVPPPITPESGNAADVPQEGRLSVRCGGRRRNWISPQIAKPGRGYSRENRTVILYLLAAALQNESTNICATPEDVL